MPPTSCHACDAARAVILRPKNGAKLCKECFLSTFEAEVHETITSHKLFHPGERVAIGASGGKDSTVLASVLKTLNERYGYGLELVLLSIDEGITGYRDDSLETVKRNSVQYDMPLEIVGYKDLYGWTMDEVVEQIGKKGNCTYCGVFRRQALDRGASKLKINHVVTGHNADDVAETVLMNLLRGDLPRLSRATSIVTESAASPIKRSKPLKYAYEKEIVMYAHHKKLEYFSTECIYSPEAFRGSARALIKDLEKIQPRAILDIVRSGEDMAQCVPQETSGNCGDCGNQQGHSRMPASASHPDGDDETEVGGCGSSTNGRASGNEMAEMDKKLREAEDAQGREVDMTAIFKGNRTLAPGSVRKPEVAAKAFPTKPTTVKTKKLSQQRIGKCRKCGYLSSQAICKACALLEGLNKSRPDRAVAVDEVGVDPSLLKRVDTISIQDANG